MHTHLYIYRRKKIVNKENPSYRCAFVLLHFPVPIRFHDASFASSLLDPRKRGGDAWCASTGNVEHADCTTLYITREQTMRVHGHSNRDNEDSTNVFERHK